MFYIDDAHRREFLTAIRETCSLNGDGRINSSFGASLYLLTGLGFTWPRLRKYVEPGCIDFEGMLEHVVLSTGESLVVRLAGNLYNGQFGRDISPIELIGDLDGGIFRLCLSALEMRKGRASLAGGEVRVA